MSDYTEKNSNLIPKIDIPCFAWNSQAEQGLLFFKAKSLPLHIVAKALKKSFFQQSTYSLKNDFTSNLHYSHTIVPAESAFTSP